MRFISRVSKKTQVFRAFLGILAFIFSVSASESDQARLREEITEARNAYDAMALKAGVKPGDPRLKEKAALLQEKMSAYRKSFHESQTPSPLPSVYLNKTPDRPNGEKAEKADSNDAVVAPTTKSSPRADAPSEPATVLSGEGISKEITYPKKLKAEKPKMNEPAPETPPTESGGIPEIQYPKKKR